MVRLEGSPVLRIRWSVKFVPDLCSGLNNDGYSVPLNRRHRQMPIIVFAGTIRHAIRPRRVVQATDISLAGLICRRVPSKYKSSKRNTIVIRYGDSNTVSRSCFDCLNNNITSVEPAQDVFAAAQDVPTARAGTSKKLRCRIQTAQCCQGRFAGTYRDSAHFPSLKYWSFRVPLITNLLLV